MIPGGVPTKHSELVGRTREWIEECNVTVGQRKAYYRLLNSIAETGKYDGTKALINTLNSHLQRVAAHMFSPVELKFSIDFENPYPPRIQAQGKQVAMLLTRQWQRNNTDIVFGNGVFEALKYGACLMKQWAQAEGEDNDAVYYKKLVMPWQFGVYDESETDINLQYAMCETVQVTLPQMEKRSL